MSRRTSTSNNGRAARRKSNIEDPPLRMGEPLSPTGRNGHSGLLLYASSPGRFRRSPPTSDRGRASTSCVRYFVKPFTSRTASPSRAWRAPPGLDPHRAIRLMIFSQIRGGETVRASLPPRAFFVASPADAFFRERTGLTRESQPAGETLPKSAPEPAGQSRPPARPTGGRLPRSVARAPQARRRRRR